MLIMCLNVKPKGNNYLECLGTFTPNNLAGRIQLNLTLRFADNITL